MSSLLVVAHPDPQSFTHHVADRLAAALPAGEAEVADLAAEGFDPRFTLADRHAYAVAGEYPADVAAEMARIDHVYSHFRMTLRAFECRVTAGVAASTGGQPLRWVGIDELAGLAMPRANRRIVEALVAEASREARGPRPAALAD